MIAATKVSTEAAAAQLAPIPSVKRYNEQQEVRCRKAVSECKHPEEQMVKNFLKEQASSDSGKRKTPTVAPSKKSSSKRPARTNKHKSPSTLQDLLPPPQYGSVYTLGEAANYYGYDLLKDDKAKSSTGKAPFSKSKGNVENPSRPTIQLCREASNHDCRRADCCCEDQLSKNHGCGFKSDDTQRALLEAEKEKKLKRGIVPKERQVCQTTVDNYRVQIANDPRVSLTQKTVIKSTTRATAESSILEDGRCHIKTQDEDDVSGEANLKHVYLVEGEVHEPLLPLYN
eukprot:scaffold16713_cov159-Skeletonema_dohrnii-CCMP3373.AAC.2